MQDPILENRMSLVQSPARPIFLLRTYDSHCDRIHSSLAAVHCFDNGYVKKRPMAWKEYIYTINQVSMVELITDPLIAQIGRSRCAINGSVVSNTIQYNTIQYIYSILRPLAHYILHVTKFRECLITSSREYRLAS